MDKAFLCYSASDRAYVSRVAKRLGRARVVYDAMSFEDGVDFRDSIVRGLSESRLFVFFVSRSSLEATWCRFELDEAQLLRMRGSLGGQLAILIDPNIRFSDLPAWMQRQRAIIQTRAVQAAREIERELYALMPSSVTDRPFVGRQSLQAEFVERLAAGMDSAPVVFLVCGLEGIGRRSYVARVLKDNLGLTLGPVRVVDSTSTLEDLYVWLLDETGEPMSRSDLANEMTRFRQLDKQSQVNEVVGRLQVICDGRFVPCILDRGGMLTDEGGFRDPYLSLLHAFIDQADDAFLSLIDTRTPLLDEGEPDTSIFAQRVPPLKPTETRLLLQQVMKREQLEIGEEALRELEPYIAGYPPAAYFVARQAKVYGLSATVADKSLLVDFKAKRFTSFLAKLPLGELEWQVLSYLASEQSIPLAAISVALDRSAPEIAPVLRNLIDNSLVVLEDENFAAAPPIRDAVVRARGALSEREYMQVRDRLTQAFWADREIAPSIEVVDATLHAVARSGAADFAPYTDLVRPSSVHRLARESYFRSEYRDAYEYAIRAQQMGADNPEIRAITFKALVRLEMWDKAGEALRAIEKAGDPQALYLQGFLLRRQRRWREALRAYELALRAGDQSIALQRDYADCLHRLGRHHDAMSAVKRVLSRQGENIFVLDLALRIFLDGARNQEDTGVSAEEVERYLLALERFDLDNKFYSHRRATLLANQERWDAALEAAEAACASNPRMIEASTLRIDILIEMGRFDEAEKELVKVNERFSVERDVQDGLRVKLLCRRGDWRGALAAWNVLRDKERPVHKGLLMRIYEIKASDFSLTLSERDEASKVASEMRAGLRIPRPDATIDVVLDRAQLDLDAEEGE